MSNTSFTVYSVIRIKEKAYISSDHETLQNTLPYQRQLETLRADFRPSRPRRGRFGAVCSLPLLFPMLLWCGQ